MERLLIQGGVPLRGEVQVSGSKNATLPLMAASLLAARECILRGAPQLRDVATMGRLLQHMGVRLESGPRGLRLDASALQRAEAPYELVKTMRASVLVLGPLLGRWGRARVSLPGGCAIGARPINLHLMGLEKMGASIRLEAGYVVARARRLRGARVCFDLPTVTGTENIMMAAALAKGTTVIENAAREPEVVDLARALRAMGARLRGEGSSVLEIQGVEELQGFDHEVIPDRIEAATFMVAAGITAGRVLIRGARAEHLDAVLQKLQEAGLRIAPGPEGLLVEGPGRPRAVDAATAPYPGFPTDVQAQLMALMCIARGSSVIAETVFENRFMHVPELQRMGADISVRGGVATVRGVKTLKAAQVMATDLRASASLVLAALAARGSSVLHRVYHLDRGYERMEEKLRALGAAIQRLT